jgi:hypothetical protein
MVRLSTDCLQNPLVSICIFKYEAGERGGEGEWKEDGILEQQMQRISQRQNDIIKHDLILVHAADHIHHDIALALVQHDPIVIENDIRGLLCGLLDEAFLECFLGFYVWVWGLCCWCIFPYLLELETEFGRGRGRGRKRVLELCAGPEAWCGAL